MEINKAFRNQIFWSTYESLYTDNTSSKEAEKWFAQLGEHFITKKETKSYIETAKQLQQAAISKFALEQVPLPKTELCQDYEKYQRLIEIKKRELSRKPKFHIKNFKDVTHYYPSNSVTISFSLPLGYALDLQLMVDLKSNAIFDQTVFLKIDDTTAYQLGYWDDSQWLPYFLKLDELKALCSYWQTDSLWKQYHDIPFCLLAKFIGIGSNIEKEELNKSYKKRLQQLGINTKEKFQFDDCYNWISTENGEEYVCVKLPKHLKNVDWNYDDKAVKSLSYSFRKQNYGELEEYENFPFEIWNNIIEKIKPTHNNGYK